MTSRQNTQSAKRRLHCGMDRIYVPTDIMLSTQRYNYNAVQKRIFPHTLTIVCRFGRQTNNHMNKPYHE